MQQISYKIGNCLYVPRSGKLVKAVRPDRPQAKYFTGHKGKTDTLKDSLKLWGNHYDHLEKHTDGGYNLSKLSKLGIPEEFHEDYMGGMSHGRDLMGIAKHPHKSRVAFHHVQDHRGITQAMAQAIGPDVRLLATAPWNMPHAPKVNKDNLTVRGSGTALMEHLVRQSIENGHDGMLRLTSDESATPFYKHLGFEPSNEQFAQASDLILSPEKAQEFLRKREQSGKALKQLQKANNILAWHKKALHLEDQITNFLAHPDF